jgi:hypothetical protein
MIDKLYKLKQQQITQQLLQKQLVISKIEDIDKQIQDSYYSLHNAGVNVMGSISDFRILEIHKLTLKEHILKLSKQKELLQKQVEYYDNNIVYLNKESEQLDYILQEEKKEKAKEIIKQEELVASEFVQARFAMQRL